MHYFHQYHFSKEDQAKVLKQKPFISKASTAADVIGECFSKSIQTSLENYKGNKVGILLSGGIDSSLLLAMIRRFTDKEIVCFTGLTSLHDPDSFPSKQLSKKFNCKWVPCIIDEEQLEKRLKVILPLSQGGLYTTAANVVLDICMEKAQEEGVDALWAGSGVDMFFGGGVNKAIFDHSSPKAFHESFWDYTFELLLQRFYKQPATQMAELTSRHKIEVIMPFENLETILVARSIRSNLFFKGKKDKYPIRILARQYGVPKRFIYRAKSPLQQSSGLFNMLRKYMYAQLPDMVRDNVSFHLTEEYFANNPNTDLQVFLTLLHEKSLVK